jgi:hypothetical protein
MIKPTANNVYWFVTGALNIGADATFKGTAVSGGAISLLSGAKLKGRALTTAGQISTTTNIATRFEGAVWTGSTSSNYGTAANWSDGLVPDSGENIRFAVSATNHCVLDKNYTVGNSENASDKNLVVNGFTYTVVGSISQTSSGKLDGSISGSTLVMAGCFAQAISENAAVANTFPNLTINNSAGVTLEGPFTLTKLLTISNGTFTTADYLTLKSNSAGTACVAPILNGSITGNVTAERFISSQGRRFRFLSSPCSGRTLADWKNEIHISGIGGNANGFDSTASNQNSVYTYDETFTTGGMNSGWIAATHISNSIEIGKGYRVFVRGPRTDVGLLDGTNSIQNEVTMDLVGPINTGDINMNPLFTNSGTLANDGWNMLGNPYPSAYNWAAFHTAGRNGTSPDYNGTNYSHIDASIYIYDASSNSYKSYNALAESGSLTDGIIPSGTAFYIKASAVAPAITFKEIFKTAIEPIVLHKMSADELYIKLIADSNNYDLYILKFVDGSTKEKDEFDILKIRNANANVSSYGKDGVELSLSSYPSFQGFDTIPLTVYSSNKVCTLEFNNVESFAFGTSLFLKDNFKNNITDINLHHSYVFTINKTEAASFGKKRFELLFERTTTGMFAKPAEWITTFAIYPNPVSELLNVEATFLKSGLYHWTIYGINGLVVNSGVCNKELESISTANLSKGFYFIEVQSETFKQVLKFVK